MHPSGVSIGVLAKKLFEFSEAPALSQEFSGILKTCKAECCSL